MSSSAVALRGLPPAHHQGFCAVCGRVHRVPNRPQRAVELLNHLFGALDSDPAHAALRAALGESPRGKMLGVLWGTDARGAEHTLWSMSGDVGGRERWEGFVPPVTPRAATAAQTEDALVRINALTLELEATPNASEQEVQALKAQRRAISAALMSAMFDSVVLCNGRGEALPLRQVFVGGGMPSGTGECAVPRLLNEANRKGIRPLAVGEAWWGAPQNGRVHGDIQHPCARKCEPILGHLLCGWETGEQP